MLWSDSREAADIADPIDPAEANEPTLAIDAKEAALPTARTESWEQIDRIEFSDQRDHTRRSLAPLVAVLAGQRKTARAGVSAEHGLVLLSGRCRIRTCEGILRRIYSPLPLAARATCRAGPRAWPGDSKAKQ